VASARRLNRTVEIVVRTRFVHDLGELHRLGATAVVPEELEASIAMAGLVMRRFGATEQSVARAASVLRGDDYELLSDRATETQRSATLASALAAAEFSETEVPAAFHGRSIGDLRIRTLTGASVVAVQRGPDLLSNPGPGFILAGGDRLAVLGSPEALQKLQALLTPPSVG
jgi:CPA2 family monovalent cation:H+ antiporter-2